MMGFVEDILFAATYYSTKVRLHDLSQQGVVFRHALVGLPGLKEYILPFDQERVDVMERVMHLDTILGYDLDGVCGQAIQKAYQESSLKPGHAFQSWIRFFS